MALIWTCGEGFARVNVTGLAGNRLEAPQCVEGHGAWVAAPADLTGSTCCTTAQLELLGITPASIGASLSFGFGLVVAFWLLGFAARAGKDAIRAA